MKKRRLLLFCSLCMINFVVSIFAISDLMNFSSIVEVNPGLHTLWVLLLCLVILVAAAEMTILILAWVMPGAFILFSIFIPNHTSETPKLGTILPILLLVSAYAWLVVISPYRWLLLTDSQSGLYISGWDGHAFIYSSLVNSAFRSANVEPVLNNTGIHLWFLMFFGFLGSFLFDRSRKLPLFSVPRFFIMVLGQTFVYRLALFFVDISDWPFTIGWSEGSRYYYASLLFSEKLYGESLSWSILHPTRYFLQAIPFLLPGLGIESHRFWQGLLWAILTGITSLLLANRLRLSNSWTFWGITAWAGLFILQGPVYYHLLVCVILILAFHSNEHPLRSFLIILISSVWAGLSRINWYPIPGLLAGTLYFLESPSFLTGNIHAYLRKPLLWIISGTLTAGATNLIYLYFSGNSASIRSLPSSLTSDMLWYRLVPNPTFPMGIALATLIASSPTILAVAWAFPHIRQTWNRWRTYCLLGYIFLLLGGGFLASVKIGGGGDLHNMDGYLVLMLIIGGYVFFGRDVPENMHSESAPRPHPWFILISAAIIPMISFLPMTGTIESADQQTARDSVQLLKLNVEAAATNGEVLFINQRQLITFGEIKIPLVQEYEGLTLMEMAMSRNSTYLQRFYQDLHNHRFEMIVLSKPFINLKGRGLPFGEENDIWVEYITIPLLCEYDYFTEIPQTNIQILIPRKLHLECSDSLKSR